MNSTSAVPSQFVGRHVPSAVRRWYETHRSEGVHQDLAMRRAIDRAYSAGEISERTTDRLERMLNAGPRKTSSA